MSILFLSFLFAIIFSVLAVAIVIYRYRSWFKKQWRKILAVGAVITISTAGVLIILPRQTGGADAWLGVTSSNWAGDCGHDTTYTLQNALDGIGTWRHATTETHWFILDLGQDYTVKQVRGRSNTTYDPTIVNVYVSTINGTWSSAVNPDIITTWCNTTDWVIIDTTDKVGRYIYVSITDTEYNGTQRLRWGNSTAFTIFDVYGSVYSTGSPNPPVIDVIEPLNASVDVYWQPMVSVWANDTDGDTLSVNWYENSTGDWTLVQTNTSVSANSTVEWWFENASMDNTMYWWNATVTDGSNTTVSWNYFTTYNPVGGTPPSEETDEDRDRNGYGWFGYKNEPTTTNYRYSACNGVIAGMAYMNNTAATADYIMALISTSNIGGVGYTGQVYGVLFYDNGNNTVLNGQTECQAVTYAGGGAGPYFKKLNFTGTKPILQAGVKYKIGLAARATTGGTGLLYQQMYTLDLSPDRGGARQTKTYNTNCPTAGNFLLYGSYTYNINIYCSYTTIDTMIPSIDINYAGNLSDKGGPYWNPTNSTGENLALSGNFLDGYYTANSKQSEGYIYINASINDTSGIKSVYLHILNETHWEQNYTYAFINRTKGYWDINTSSNFSFMPNTNYSFDVVANNTLGYKNSSIWRKINKGSFPGKITWSRRYVQLNSTQVNISYMPLYLVNTTAEIGNYPTYNTYDLNGADRLRNDQGPDNTINDTGYLANVTLTDTMQNRWCTGAYAYYFGQSICPSSFTLNNIYYHMWWNVELGDEISLIWDTIRSYWLGGGGNNVATLSYGASRSNIFYDNPISAGADTFYLNTGVMATTGSETSFTDNNIYELILMTSVVSSPMSLCNQSIQSFILLNVPSNESLNITGDTDGDGLSDYKELYVNYTNPFIADTDNDGVDDYDETLSGSDPNNYTSTITYTPPDSTFPDITINFAGNLSDMGGPYWIPPDETIALSGQWLNGYYTNDSRQSEDWIYINVTANDSESTVTDVWLQWLNSTTWTNWTYSFTQNGTKEDWAINTSGVIQTCDGCNYSFDIVANSSGGSNWVAWNKTAPNYNSHFNPIPHYVRRYVQLNCTQINISYTPFYGYNFTYGEQDFNVDKDRYMQDLGIDAGGERSDTGYLLTDVPTDTVSAIKCGSYCGYWFGDSICIKPLILNNIYCHIWWTSNDGVLEGYGSIKYGLNWRKTREGMANDISINGINITKNNSKSNLTYNVTFNPLYVYNDSLHLNTQFLDVTDTDFTDNNIYEFLIYIYDYHDNVTIACNRSFTSFVLFNVPDNETLNTSYVDSDSDSLSDWTELYINYTNPFLSDTDNDGVTDYNETLSGSDPNNYTDTIPYTLPSGGFLEYNSTIRKQGTDYFVWLGGNTSAYNVSSHISGLDEREEYIGLQGNDTWSNTNATWIHYHYFDKSGTNFTVTTFDVIEVYLTDGAGSVVVNMHENDYMNYTNSKTYTWVNNTKNKGYNYTGYNRMSDTTLSAINTSVTLQSGEFIALWNKTSYTWVIYNAGIGITDDNVEQWDIILSKVEDKTAPYEVWNT